MLIAIVDFEVAPENQTKALDILLAKAPAVHKMDGCVKFRPFTDPQSNTHVGVLHEWDHGEGFAAYTTSAMFAEVGEILRPMMTTPPSSRRFNAELIENTV